MTKDQIIYRLKEVTEELKTLEKKLNEKRELELFENYGLKIGDSVIYYDGVGTFTCKVVGLALNHTSNNVVVERGSGIKLPADPAYCKKS